MEKMETKMISAGEAMDWMMENPNQVIEDDIGARWQFSEASDRAEFQRLGTKGAWNSDYFGPVEASRKFKLPITPEPVAETPATMTPGEALDWMIANPGKELVDNEDARIRVHALRGVQCAPAKGQWSDEDVSALIGHTFRFPERTLPELPEGCAWRRYDDGRRLGIGSLVDDGDWEIAYPSLETQHDRDISAALVEEFDTRPR